MPKYPPRNNPARRLNSRPRSSADLLQRAAGAGLTRSALEQDPALTERLKMRLVAQLPEGLGQHVLSLIAKPKELVVFTESGAWAARLKIAIAEQRPQLAPEVGDDALITLRVMPTGQFRR